MASQSPYPNRAVVFYGTGRCGFCTMARRLLREKGVHFVYIDVANDPMQRELMEQRSGRTSVPQIFVGDLHLGGYTDLQALDDAGELDPLLGLNPS